MNLIIFTLSLILAAVAAQDWCNSPYCSTPGTHVACNHNGQFGPDCVNPIAVVFTTTQIQAILNTHNQWRHDTAAGIISGFQGEPLPPATRMAKIQWSSELAFLADLNTKSCVMTHDTCRGTSQFNFAGQNLAGNVASSINVTYAVIDSINRWASEHVSTRISDISSLQGVYGGNGQVIGHFTAVVNEKMTHVGCGMTLYTRQGWQWGLFACNYAFNNFIGRRVYQAGPVASHCTTGRDSTFSNLCTINENINVNDWNRLLSKPIMTPTLNEFN